MHYKNEKEIIIEKLDELIGRGGGFASQDPEVGRLWRAKLALLGRDGDDVDAGEEKKNKEEVLVKQSVVDEFAKAYQFLLGLKGEKDLSKAVAGLIEVIIFLFTIVTALSTREATRNDSNSDHHA